MKLVCWSYFEQDWPQTRSYKGQSCHKYFQPKQQRRTSMVSWNGYFLPKFTLNYSKVAAPFRLLQKKDIEWHWNAEQVENLEFDFKHTGAEVI